MFNNRYNYATVDFSDVREPGLYCIEYKGTRTNPFPVDAGVYAGTWYPTMDVWLPVQMDHMEVNEGYRIWHGRSHMDDALQAPPGYEEMDGYRQGAETNTKYAAYEHIPNLAVGAWYDAGDFDIQSGTVIGLTQQFATLWEEFRPERDQTYIDQKTQFVDIHRPDGVPDVIQQCEHGVLNINAQVENIGFVAQGIVQGTMHQYHHLGDASTITDGLVYDASLAPYEQQGLHDVEVVSTMGLTDDDVDALRGVDGVDDAVGVHIERVTIDGEGGHRLNATLREPADGAKDAIDVPYVREGRLPDAPGEVAVTEQFAHDTHHRIGDTIDVTATSGGDERFFEVPYSGRKSNIRPPEGFPPSGPNGTGPSRITGR